VTAQPVHRKVDGGTGQYWFDEDDAQEWYVDNIETSSDLATVQLRKQTADATLAELRLLKANYQSIGTELVLAIYTEQCGNIAANLKSLITVKSLTFPPTKNELTLLRQKLLNVCHY